MLLKKESVEAHIYRTFIAAALWRKLVFYAFGNDSPGPLFTRHAHKFLVFTAGQKCAKACSSSPASSGRGWRVILGRRQCAHQGQNPAGRWALSGHFFQGWGKCCVTEGPTSGEHTLLRKIAGSLKKRSPALGRESLLWLSGTLLKLNDAGQMLFEEGPLKQGI